MLVARICFYLIKMTTFITWLTVDYIIHKGVPTKKKRFQLLRRLAVWHYKNIFPTFPSLSVSLWSRFRTTFASWRPRSKPIARWRSTLAHFPSFFSPSGPPSGPKPRPMAPISERGRPGDRLVNIHEKATTLVIPTHSRRGRGRREWPQTGRGESWKGLDFIFSEKQRNC